MKFKSALVTQASGSVGGMTFSRNRYGMYVRGKGLPVNPNTPKQQIIRAIFQGLSVSWNGDLDADERDAWNAYAESCVWTDVLGEPVKLSGQSMFVQCNTPRLQAGLARVDAAPEIFTQPALPTFTLAATADDQKFSVGFVGGDAWASEVGAALLVYLSRPVGASINFFKGPYQYAAKIAGAAVPPTSPVLVDVPFALSAGQQVGCHIRLVRADGRISVPFRVLTPVGAGT